MEKEMKKIYLTTKNGLKYIYKMSTKEQIDDIREKVIKGLTKTYEKLLEMKRRNNSVIVYSDNGQIIKVKPEDK